MSVEVERAVVGAAILGAPGREILARLTDADFADPRLRELASVIREMQRRGTPVDAITVSAEAHSRDILARMPAEFTFELSRDAPVPASAGYYADLLRGETRVRLHKDAAAFLDRCLEDPDAPAELETIIAAFRSRLADIPGPLTAVDPNGHTVRELMSKTDSPEDWLVPGLIERGERIIITGAEGSAKSVLMRQVAASLAAGVHPWTGVRIGAGARVLHIDAENSERQSRHGYRMVARSRALSDGWQDRLWVYVRNDGLALSGRDAGWFQDVADQCKPDLIVIGPAYKLMRGGDPQLDTDVMRLQEVIDEVRVRHNAAVLIEHHMPHGGDGGARTVRPYGSSVWLRWPEVGFGVRRDPDIPAEAQERRPHYLQIVDWRGSREDRDWPTHICWGAADELPWVPYGVYEPDRGQAA